MSAETYLDLLPPELKCHLVKFLDGKTLICLGTLSPEWMDIICYDCKKEWRIICMSEIPSDYLSDIKISLYPSYWQEENLDDIWSDLYFSWFNWRNLSCESVFYQIPIYNTRYDISALAISGSWVFIGTREGLVEAVDIDKISVVPVISMCGKVINLDLRCSKSDDDRVYDGADHDELLITTNVKHIKYNLNDSKHTFFWKGKKHHNELRHFESQEVSVINAMYSAEVVSSNGSETSKTFNDTNCSVVQVWDDKILLLFENGRLQVFDYQLKPLEDFKINSLKLDFKILTEFKQLVISHLDVLFLLDNSCTSNLKGKSLEIVVGNVHQMYRPLTTLGTEVTSVLYHAGVLFLGGANGYIYVFRVNSDTELLYLDMRKPLLEVNVTKNIDDPILSMALQENSTYKFYLAAASMNEVYILSTTDIDKLF